MMLTLPPVRSSYRLTARGRAARDWGLALVSLTCLLGASLMAAMILCVYVGLL